MAKAVHYIPEGYTTVTPYLVVKGAAEALAWYGKAFGAEEVVRMPMPDGRLMHAEMRIGNSMIMLGDEFPEMGGNRSPQSLGGTAVGICLYVKDVDAVFQQAVAAGAKAKMPPADMFWGDRYGKVADPYGHEWSLATHKEDVPPEEMGKRAQAAMAQMCNPPA